MHDAANRMASGLWLVSRNRDFSPTKALVNVDLPVLGRPTKLMNPERNPSGVSVKLTCLLLRGEIQS